VILVILIIGMLFDAAFSKLAAVVRKNRGLGITRL
jgi:hypothetical protein